MFREFNPLENRFTKDNESLETEGPKKKGFIPPEETGLTHFDNQIRKAEKSLDAPETGMIADGEDIQLKADQGNPFQIRESKEEREYDPTPYSSHGKRGRKPERPKGGETIRGTWE